MKGFKLDSNGDVEIIKNEIQMIDGNELLRQTVKSVLNTNKKEWFFDENEGITFSNILGKQKDEDIIRNEIQQGLLQVNSSFIMNSFEMSVDRKTRGLRVNFTAQTEDGINYIESIYFDTNDINAQKKY